MTSRAGYLGPRPLVSIDLSRKNLRNNGAGVKSLYLSWLAWPVPSYIQGMVSAGLAST